MILRGREYVSLRRYPPAPDTAVMISRLREGSNSYIYQLTGIGPFLAQHFLAGHKCEESKYAADDRKRDSEQYYESNQRLLPLAQW